MSGVLCLKWNNHTTTFIKALDSLRSRELYCDATIACHGKYFPVHRFVLTTCSEYFEEIFERTQCKHPFIIVKDVEELQLEALLNYMYKGEVNVLQERLPGLIRAAEALKVKGLAVTEDEVEERKPIKEKRKANSISSPLQPKSKRKHIEIPSIATVKQSQVPVNEDITEIQKPSLQQSLKKTESKHSRNGSNISENFASNASNLELPFQNNDENYSDNAAESEIDDIKVEPTEIFESVEDEFPTASNEHMSLEESKEESLFCSLLSPTNAQSISEEEALVGDEANSQTMPQCSSWSDELSTTSDKLQDEINPLKLKPMVELQEGSSFSGLAMGLNPLSVGSDSFASNREALYNALYAPHQCPQCLHRTKTKPELLRHVAYCHSDFRFTCALCHYKCRTNGLLKKHMLKHTKEKPYSCPVCSYKTARKQHLVRHSKLHTGEKPYSCTFCSYKASRKDRLREHLRKHPEIEDFNFEGNVIKNQEVEEFNFDGCEN